MRLLVVEDDPDLNRQLAAALTDAGYVVDRAFDGEEGHYLGESEPYDAVILDIGLPKMDGISVLESWRRTGRAMPVLMLTARDRWSDKVQGFDAGADDYVAKPFHLEEVLARVRALLRRAIVLLGVSAKGQMPPPLPHHLFALENGTRQLARHFFAVVRYDLPSTLIFPSIEPVMTYLDSTRDVHKRYERLAACARNLTLPTLLVRGGSSDVVSEEGVRDFKVLCPHAETVDVQQAGHMVAGDRNDAFTSAVVAFLDRELAADPSTSREEATP